MKASTEKRVKPNYIDTINPNEVKVYARDLGKTGGKQLYQFSADRGVNRVGDEFMFNGRRYMIDKITG
jgi:uncharacterized protein (UPF0128 family)